MTVTTIDQRRQHNLRLPISRLPNEILSSIFCILRSNFVSAAETWRRTHGLECLKGWVTITYVCRAWREVALDTSVLWCHIDISFGFHNWIPELLRRSKQSLLRVTVAIDWARNRRQRDLLEELKKHLGRVRELALLGLGSAITYEILSSESQATFQNLETLDIRMYEIPFTLNDSHLRAECLRCLSLDSCSIDWNSKFLQGLTHLRLVDMPDGCRLGCHDFILVLSKIPALETLHLSYLLLENVNDNDEEVQTHRATKVHLQHLQQLHMASEVQEMAQFLSSLVVPRSCKLYLQRTWCEGDVVCDKFRVILSWISNHFRVPEITPLNQDASNPEQYIRTFHLEHRPGADFKMEGFGDVLEQLDIADPIFRFVIDWSCDEEDYDVNLRNFLSFLPLSGVTSLGVFNDVELSPESWTVAFGSIPTLKTIYLEIATPPFWQALTPANPDNGTIKSLPFPTLSSIAVEEDYPDFQLILDTLRVRSELGGTRLQDLCFSSQSVPPTPIMIQLGELVNSIEYVEN